MSLISVLNECNNSVLILDKSMQFHPINFIYNNPKKSWIIEYNKLLDKQKHEKYKAKEKYFGFWNKDLLDSYPTIKIIEKTIIKEIFPEKIENPPGIPAKTEKIIIDACGFEQQFTRAEFNLDSNITEVKPIIEDQELEQYKPIKQEFTIEQLANMLNEKYNRLFDIINTYDNLVYNNPNFNEIMNLLYTITHKSNGNKQEREKWIEKFPNEIDRKIENIKKENKKKNRSLKQKEHNRSFNQRATTLRKLNIIRHMNSEGYYGFNEDQIWHLMEIKRTNDEIYEFLIDSLRDKFGNDNDMVEIDEDKQYNDHLDYMNGKYEFGDPNE